MSLVGNLEDLSLGDIMQIISLSQKSGVLALNCEEGAGRIVFRSGLVDAANLEGRGDDLRDLVVETVDASTYDAFVAHADKVGESVVDLLIAKRNLTTEQLDGLLRDSVESSILEMFGWCSGDFSFDVRTQLDRADPQLILSTGVNAQYLAMEGMRICDERAHNASLSSAEPETQEPVQESTGGSDGLFGEEFVDLDAGRPPTPSDSAESLSVADIVVATILSNDAAAHDSEFERTSEAPNIECLETELVEANFESEGVVIDEFEFSNDAVSEP